MNYRWIIRASRLARHPPSSRQMIVIAVVVVLCLGLYGVEQIWGLPEWFDIKPARRLLR